MSDSDADGPADREIRTLDESTVQRIAAGEVVERPASVVKELVENSLDAGASRIAVAVRAGGSGGVRVRDDGVGMTAEQLEVAVEEHTTSKISGGADLDRGVGTLGFRGEALYTIGAVSRLTARSKPRGSTGAGAELTVEGGDVGEVRPAGCPEGTTVEVEDLFFNTPARKKFLKTEATEFDHVNTVVTQYALANPDVAVSLEHDGREVFATEGSGDLRSAVLSVYGREVAESMVAVEWSAADAEDAEGEGDGGVGSPPEGDDRSATAPVASVTGLVSHPETTRSGREYMSTFVNGRYVTASVLREAILDAYGGQLAPDRYPFAVLFVEVPPEAVDVNVHPRKMEVRFDDERTVGRTVSDAVESALLDHGLVRSTAPRGRSAPEETDVAPEPADSDVVGGAGTRHETASDAATDRPRTDGTPSEVESSGSSGAAADEPPSPSETAAGGPPAVESGDEDGDRDEGAGAGRVEGEGTGRVAGAAADTDPTNATGTDADPADEDLWSVDVGPDERPADPDGPDRPAGDDADGSTFGAEAESAGPTPDTEGGGDAARTPGVGDADRAASDPSRQAAFDVGDAPADGTGEASAAGEPFGVTGPTTQRTLAGGDAEVDRAFDSLPRMRVLGQFDGTYVVAETPEGLVLVDQHAADERVNYERLRAAVGDGAASQSLAESVELELTAREAALFEEYDGALSAVGFAAERTGERTVAVRRVPAVFDATLDPELLRDALTAFVTAEDEGGRETVEDAVDSLLADLACYPSVTGNTSLTEGTVVELLEALDGCENPYACPHGRPVIIEFSREDVEDRFERDYPGHAGRREE